MMIVMKETATEEEVDAVDREDRARRRAAHIRAAARA